jgi:hypothetical protein
MRIYVASSWRNDMQPVVVSELRRRGHQVFDFRDASAGVSPFRWTDGNADDSGWSPVEQQVAWMRSDVRAAFHRDMSALSQSEATLLVAPAGRSAHLELGWAAAAHQKTAVLLAEGQPELMYGMVDAVCTSVSELCAVVEAWSRA